MLDIHDEDSIIGVRLEIKLFLEVLFMNSVSKFLISIASCTFLFTFSTLNCAKATSVDEVKSENSEIVVSNEEKISEEAKENVVVSGEKEASNEASSDNPREESEGKNVGNVKINVQERCWEASYSIYCDDNGKIVKVVNNT